MLSGESGPVLLRSARWEALVSPRAGKRQALVARIGHFCSILLASGGSPCLRQHTTLSLHGSESCMTQQGARPVLSASWGMTGTGAELSQGGEMPRPRAGAAGLAQDLCGTEAWPSSSPAEHPSWD